MTWDLEASSGNGVWTYVHKDAIDYDKLRSLAEGVFETIPSMHMVRITDSENNIVFFEWRRGR